MKFITDFNEFGAEHGKSLLDHLSTNAIEGKAKVLRYLKDGLNDGVRCSGIFDYVKGESTMDTIHLFTDGEYYWDSEEIYHFEKYNIPLDEQFLKKVLS